MKTIMVKGQVVFIDDDNLDYFLAFRWSLNNRGYAQTSQWKGDHSMISMHEKVIGKAPPGYEIHHKDGNKLNNQKANLEYKTRSEHQMMKKVQRNNTTGFKGVAFDKARRRYMASIEQNGNRVFIGRFHTAIDAAKAYNAKALELHGPTAFQNPIPSEVVCI